MQSCTNGGATCQIWRKIADSSKLVKRHFLRKYSSDLLVWHTNASVVPCSFQLCNKMAPLELFFNFIGDFVGFFQKNHIKIFSSETAEQNFNNIVVMLPRRL